MTATQRPSTCETCKHFLPGTAKWIGNCTIVLPPSCAPKTDNPSVTRADSRCDLWLGAALLEPAKAGQEKCNRVLQFTANSYPRTCAVCGITGPCQYP